MADSDIRNESADEGQCQKPSTSGGLGLPLECPACGFRATDLLVFHPVECSFGLSLERVGSSNLWGLRLVEYGGAEAGSLYVAFKAKGTEIPEWAYRYDGVTVDQVREITSAESIGKAFYAFRKTFEGGGGEAVKVWTRNEEGR